MSNYRYSVFTLVFVASCGVRPPPHRSLADTAAPIVASVAPPPLFYIHDLGHRCIDVGAQAAWANGGPVYLYACNGTAAQQFRVRELDASHDVSLSVRLPDPTNEARSARAAGDVVVVTPQREFCLGVRGGKMILGAALELQVCSAAPTQRFALDGDAILMGAQSAGVATRELAIAPEHASTVQRTALVVTERSALDTEYFRFVAVDHSDANPTSGFVTVTSESDLDQAIARGWGTVVQIDARQALELKGPFPKQIVAGTTVRGYRKYIDQGPEIHSCAASDQPAFLLTQSNVRITGLRMRGPNGDPRCASKDRPEASAILIEPNSDGQLPTIWVDHIDTGYWTGSALDVRGSDGSRSQVCPNPVPAYPRPVSLNAVGNFIHHNGAYGTVSGQGAFVLNRANVFYGQHAHSIASDPWGTTGYAAYDNFVLSETRVHDFDAHGSLHPDHWYDGLSGDYYDMGWNTFLPTSHENINQRGTPCRFTAIHDSVFLQSKSAAIVTRSTSLIKHVVYANVYNAANPTQKLAVGDFDGDGIDDVFVGTGSGWYYSSGGQAEWRFLNRMPEHADALLFGDFDGDGRTDVVALHGANIDISWGGMSPWQTINVTAGKFADLAVGDFDGDHHADLFLSTGSQWFYAPGGRNWTPFDTSSYRVAQLKFGDFTHAGKTEILRAHSGRWEMARLGQGWTDIGAAPTNSVDGLVVGDFGGDGFTGLARANIAAKRWEYTAPGHGSGWNALRFDTRPLLGRPVGHFDGNAGTDVIIWNGRQFDYASGAHDPVQRLSRQEMQ